MPKYGILYQSFQESKMNFKPIGDRCIVKRCEEQKIIGNIITLNPEPSQFFEVIALSESAYDCNTCYAYAKINVGDIVLIPKYGYNTVELEGVIYGIVKIEDILAVRG